MYSLSRQSEQPLDPQRPLPGSAMKKRRWKSIPWSCAAIDIDHFMERSYLNALGDALKIPQDVREGIERDLEQQKTYFGGVIPLWIA